MLCYEVVRREVWTVEVSKDMPLGSSSNRSWTQSLPQRIHKYLEHFPTLGCHSLVQIGSTVSGRLLCRSMRWLAGM
jgi:hypothetical protein